jgi:uncharacterized protein YjbI with pentapeptide repeats
LGNLNELRHKFIKAKLVKIINVYWGLDDLIALLILFSGLVYFWLDIPENSDIKIFQIYQAIQGELIGTGITVLILGNADQYIRTKLEKRKLMLQMGSHDNGFALEATRQLFVRGWIVDGSTKGVDLVGANLKRADLMGANLENANLTNANLEEASLSGACLIHADLMRAKLSHAHLKHANLMGVRLKEAELVESNLVYASLIGAYLKGANLYRADLYGSFFSALHEHYPNYKSHFFWAKPERQLMGKYIWADLEAANLMEANLQSAYLVSSDLNHANLEGANLEKANLQNANLAKITFNENTKWTNAKYNIETIWPEGFDPDGAGAIFVEN